MADKVKIVPVSEDHIPGLRDMVETVARERLYLANTRGFTLAETQAFVKSILSGAGVQFIALTGDRSVGWCDIVRKPYRGFEHVGTLGMGVIKNERNKGIGSLLLKNTIQAAADIGITRIELETYRTNETAIHLYEKFGFETEGIKKQARILDGRIEDMVCMALIRNGE